MGVVVPPRFGCNCYIIDGPTHNPSPSIFYASANEGGRAGHIEQHGLQAQMQAALQYVVNEMPTEPLLALAKLCASPALLLNPPHPFENIPLILNPLIVGAFRALAASPRRTRSSSRRHTMRRMRTRTPTRRAIRSARSSCSLIRMAMASST